jgi:hypothetical protein
MPNPSEIARQEEEDQAEEGTRAPLTLRDFKAFLAALPEDWDDKEICHIDITGNYPEDIWAVSSRDGRIIIE